MKSKQITTTISGILLVIILTSFVSALTIRSITANPDTIGQGSSTLISVNVENNGDDSISDVTATISLTGLPFTSSTTSRAEDELDVDDDVTFGFNVQALNNAKSGIYSIPVQISWKENNITKTATGSVVITVNSEPVLEVQKQEGAVIQGQENTVTIQIVNKGLSDAEFLQAELGVGSYTLTSPGKVYVGQLVSDDTNTVDFKLYPKTAGTISLPITLTYSDIANKQYTKDFSVDVRVYSQQEALQLGLISKSNVGLYVALIIVLIILYLIYRRIRKWMKNRKAKESAS